jgi:IS1 family transposase
VKIAVCVKGGTHPELWSFVRKKEAHLTIAEKVLALYGDAWVWIAFAPAWRLAAAFVVGKRDQDNANMLLQRLHAVSCGSIPFFTSTLSRWK